MINNTEPDDIEVSGAIDRLSRMYSRQKLLNSVEFAFNNVSNLNDKEVLSKLIQFLKKAPEEADIEEIRFFHIHFNDLMRKGILPDTATLELHRRKNVQEVLNDPSIANSRVVSLNADTVFTPKEQQIITKVGAKEKIISLLKKLGLLNNS